MGRRRGHGARRAVRAGGDPAPPALPSLAELPAFSELRASAAQLAAYERAREAALAECAGGELRLGCVVRLDRGFPAVLCADGVVRAEFSARLAKGVPARAAVGDWVCLRLPASHDRALIQEMLPRESDVARWRGGARGERQTLAANVDVVIVVAALGRDAPPAGRVARAAVVARDCGSAVAVVLTKADRVGADAVTEAVRAVRAVLGPGVAVVVTCAGAPTHDDAGGGGAAGVPEGADGSSARGLRRAAEAAGARWGLSGVRALVPAGTLAIVLGESGAGKSTLLNALLGRDVLETGAVRAADDAGRHTTVARRMVSLSGAGVIVDEPGLRSLPLVGHERGLALVFPAISEAARACRFRDCTHTHEPGCAVRAGLAAGSFSEEALACYLSLAQEMRASAAALDPDVIL